MAVACGAGARCCCGPASRQAGRHSSRVTQPPLKTPAFLKHHVAPSQPLCTCPQVCCPGDTGGPHGDTAEPGWSGDTSTGTRVCSGSGGQPAKGCILLLPGSRGKARLSSTPSRDCFGCCGGFGLCRSSPHCSALSLQGSSAWAGSILNSLSALEQSPWVSLPWHGAQALLSHVHCCWGFSAGLCVPGRETEARSKEAAEDGSQACARSRQMSPAQDGAGELPASPPTLSPSQKTSSPEELNPSAPGRDRSMEGAWSQHVGAAHTAVSW